VKSGEYVCGAEKRQGTFLQPELSSRARKHDRETLLAVKGHIECFRIALENEPSRTTTRARVFLAPFTLFRAPHCSDSDRNGFQPTIAMHVSLPQRLRLAPPRIPQGGPTQY
jgi:hypothetical protein